MILCFGEALVDLYALPLGASVEGAECFAPRPGGAPANVAITLARLGAPSAFAGAVGRDGHGERLVSAMRGAGVDTSAVQRLAARTGITFVSARGDARSFLFYRVGGADYAPSVDALAPAARALDAAWILLGSSVFVTDALAACARRLLADAAARGARVAVDLNVRAHLGADEATMRDGVALLLERASLVKASDDDLRALAMPDDAATLASRLRTGSLAVVTRGARGWEAAWGERRWRGEAERVEAVDATGAGDAFTAGLLATLWRGPWGEGVIEAALRRAAALGALAVTKMGAVEALAGEALAEAFARARAGDDSA
ncbi:MAG: PfkB family carbohydrate kinase [Polyangiales bacterium]